MGAHAPKAKFTYLGDSFAQNDRVVMPAVSAYMVEKRTDVVSRPFQSLEEPASMGDQQAGYAFRSIVANRSRKNLLNILAQVRHAFGGGAAGVDKAGERLVGFHGSPDGARWTPRYGANLLEPINAPARRIASWRGRAQRAPDFERLWTFAGMSAVQD